jgi:hypothetical protein
MVKNLKAQAELRYSLARDWAHHGQEPQGSGWAQVQSCSSIRIQVLFCIGSADFFPHKQGRI